MNLGMFSMFGPTAAPLVQARECRTAVRHSLACLAVLSTACCDI